MAWVRIEDAVTEHRKHLKAGPAAAWLWVCGIAYCQRQSSDGFIPIEAVPLLGVRKGALRLAQHLVAVGLFDIAEGGYRVHDYHDYNETRDEAQKRRLEHHDAKVRAGLAGSRARWQKDSRPIADANNRAIAPSPPIPSHPDLDPNVEAKSVQQATQSIGRTRTNGASGGDARFETFWAGYPNKKKKKEAEKAWLRIKPSLVLFDRILEAVEAQKQWPEWTKDGGRYVPHPATWLNAGSWDDEPIQSNGSLLSETARYNIAASEEAGRLIDDMEARRGHH